MNNECCSELKKEVERLKKEIAEAAIILRGMAEANTLYRKMVDEYELKVSTSFHKKKMKELFALLDKANEAHTKRMKGNNND